MRLRHLAMSMIVAAAGTAWAVIGPTGAVATAAPVVASAVCHHRVCLVTLDLTSDSDGDGVTDIDEAQAGTDPKDPFSYPGAPELIDLAITGELASFERHLTEIVVLPKDTPSGKDLATGFGAFATPNRAWDAYTPGKLLGRLHDLGFNSLTNVLAQVARPETTVGNGMPPWGPEGGIMLIGAGETVTQVVGPTNFGPNAGLRPTSVVHGSKTEDGGTREFEIDGDDILNTYTVNYAGGAHDDVTGTGGVSNNGNNKEFAWEVKSYDSEGNLIAVTAVVVTGSYDPSTGATTASFTAQTTFYDDAGKETGGTQTNVTVVVKDGKTTTTTETWQFDENGKQVGKKVTTTTVTENKPKTDGESKDHKYSDPDYLSIGPITGADVARVVSRINASRTPGPDTGLGDATIDVKRVSRWPLVALINPDGVVAIAVGTTPTFNRAQPDYDPRLSELANHAGVSGPRTNDNGDISWPD